MTRIGIDLDGVAYKFVDELRLYIHKTRGLPLEKMPPATRWEFYEDWGFTLEEYLAILDEGVKAEEIFWKGELYEGCRDVINYLYHVRGDEIYIVTARRVKDLPQLARQATLYWLNHEARIPYDELVMSDNKFDHELDLLFDDAPYHFEKKRDIKCAVVFDQLWNRHVTNAPRVVGWDGLLKHVEKNYPRQVEKFQESS